jgi:hypothetical protein
MVKYADGPTMEVEVEVGVSAAVIWPLISDIDMPARFSEEFQGAEWIDGVGPAIGSRFRGRNRHPVVGEWTTECTVVDYEPERAFGWVVGDVDNVLASWRFDLERDGERTRLRMSARMGPGPSGITAAIEARPDREDDIIERRLGEWRSNMTATVEGIKASVESA